jgi:hypothetical protein
MHPRTYALSFVTLAAGLFLAVVGMNLAIDTQGVFGTGLLGKPLNPNVRYQRFVAYTTASNRYDGLLFGSSRAFDLLNPLQGMDGATFADFAVQFGMITDHLPVLEYALREKAGKHERLRAVFLLLDADSIGDRPKTNRYLSTLLAPPVTGESRLRFWWRYLAAIQIGTWRGEIVRAWKKARAAEGLDAAAASAPGPAEGGEARPAGGVRPNVREPELPEAEPASGRITARPDYARQLRLLQQFAALCKRHDVRLTVAIAPLSHEEGAKYDPAELTRVIDEVSRIVPVWDFTNSRWLAEHPELWADSRHFAPEVGRLMLARIFGDAALTVPSDFGWLRTPTAQ